MSQSSSFEARSIALQFGTIFSQIGQVQTKLCPWASAAGGRGDRGPLDFHTWYFSAFFAIFQCFLLFFSFFFVASPHPGKFPADALGYVELFRGYSIG